MRCLIACEFSGTVRDAFIARGHEAVSCDLLDTERDGPHFCGDVLTLLNDNWDLMIAHPPCTYLTVAANKWMKPEYRYRFPERSTQREEAIKFFMALATANIPRIAVENPVCIMASNWRKPDQVIQPWMFGHGETKATCLWLRGLPLLQPTHRKNDLFAAPEPEAREQRIHKLPPSKNRWKERSRTFTGVASAMAEQWG